MLVTSAGDRRNRLQALALAGASAVVFVMVGWISPPAYLLLVLCPVIYWLVRRRSLRRLRVMRQPFPPAWEQILQTHIAYYRALTEQDKERFRQLVMVFLDEVRITGIRTSVDDTVRVLVAASAAIPIFGFHDWEYHRLGEVLIYPHSFGEKYLSTGVGDANILGMVGLEHLSGVMILSKPSLLAGFDNPSSTDNVGVHEFAHLVERDVAAQGLPAEVPINAVRHWVQYVAQELSHVGRNRAYINNYAYTNEHEYFAVLAEYFFKSPEFLQAKDPQLYAMLREMFHQDTWSLLQRASARRRQYGRNEPCPCGSGKKYHECCLSRLSDNKNQITSV